MSFRTSAIIGLLAGAAFVSPQAQAGSPLLVSGALYGDVHNNAGVPQIGATVYLYNQLDQMIRQTLTNEGGRFGFDSLPAGTYSVRVTMASFFPARRGNIAIAPGSENLLHVNLGSLFSAVDIAPPSAVPGALMSDDWKWVLRTSSATRPVLRLTPVSAPASSHRHLAPNFTEVTGLVKLSAGDSGPVAGSGAQDFGTAFAVSSRVNGASQVRLSGDVGYIANSGLPTAAFRTTYSRDQDDGQPGPQMTLTMRQIYFPGLVAGATNPGTGYPSTGEAGPALRTISLGAFDRLQINDDMLFEYGGNIDSVSLIQHETRMSPFGRLTDNLGDGGAVLLAFSSGTPATQLLTRDNLASLESGNPELNQDLAALSVLPAISLSGGRTRLEGQRNLEAGYRLTRGRRKYYATAYSQSVSNAAFNMAAPPIFSTRADLLPALDGNYYVFDIGAFQRTGYMAAVTQGIGDHADFTLSAGRSGDLVASPASGGSAADVRDGIRSEQRLFVMARASAAVPGIGMRVAASYGWTADGALMPTYYSLTGPMNQEQGLNIAIHQPLPHLTGSKGRLEATAELLNALANGYLPVSTAGHCSVLTDAPRALRGGLSFVF